MLRKITAKILCEHGACESEVVLFEKTFPDGARVTCSNVLRAISAGLDIYWAVGVLLPQAVSAEYSSIYVQACEKYGRGRASTHAAHVTAIGDAWTLYEKACDIAYAEWCKARAAVRTEYEKSSGSAHAEYVRAGAAGTDSWRYRAACDVARDEQDKLCKAAYVEYDKARDAVRIEHDNAIAHAFVRAWNKQEGRMMSRVAICVNCVHIICAAGVLPQLRPCGALSVKREFSFVTGRYENVNGERYRRCVDLNLCGACVYFEAKQEG